VRWTQVAWLVVRDGAPGLIKDIEELWPEADRGRCAVHKLWNVVAELSKRSGPHDEVRLRTGQRWMKPPTPPMPNGGSDLLERSLEEVRRRTKVIGRFRGETGRSTGP
jgi:hypothetical protein